MKKLICIFFALFLISFLFGCGAQNIKEPNDQTQTQHQISTGTATSPSDSSEKTEIEITLPLQSEPSQIITAEGTGETTLSGPKPDAAPVYNDEYFRNSVFIGDSIMEGIRQYVVKHRKVEPTLGDAKFIATTIGISLADLVKDKETCLYYIYKGKEQPLEDILSEFESVERIFLMLGLNDLASCSDPQIDIVVDRYLRLVKNLSKQFPHAEVIILTNPPKVASTWLPNYTVNKNFNNALIAQFVSELIRMCDENAIKYFDMHSILKDETGSLPDTYCRDGYVHLSDEGARIVVEALYKFAEDSGDQP